jgi:hypothetical protein
MPVHTVIGLLFRRPKVMSLWLAVLPYVPKALVQFVGQRRNLLTETFVFYSRSKQFLE